VVIYDPKNPRKNWFTTNNNEFTVIKSVQLSNSKFEQLFEMEFDVCRAKKPCYARNSNEKLNAADKYTYHNPCNETTCIKKDYGCK
jgi:hypothetical protein